MENLWIFYALSGLLVLGLWDFIKKLLLAKWANKELFLITCFLIYVPVFALNMLFQGNVDVTWEILKHALIVWVADFFIPLWMLISLKYLNVSFALVAIRLISSFLVLFVGMNILWDQLSLYNIFWFFLWAFSIYLLSGFSFKNMWKIHTKWLVGAALCIWWIVLSHSYLKHIIVDVNVHDFMTLKFLVSFICISMYIFLRKKYQDFNITDFKISLPYALLSAFLFVLHFLYILPNIYINGTLSLSYKILSYSLIVPILMSVFFLWEKITKKKAFAFMLTIISIALFV